MGLETEKRSIGGTEMKTIREAGKVGAAGAAALLLFSLVQAAPASAATSVEDEKPAVATTGLSFQQISSNQLQVTSSDHDFEVRDGVMVAVDRATGGLDPLPAQGVDSAGNNVTLYYDVAGPGVVVVTAVLTDATEAATVPSQPVRTKRAAVMQAGDDWRCWLGIVGSGIGGALAGAAAGSAVPGLGTVAGGIAGAISGNAVGTATFC